MKQRILLVILALCVCISSRSVAYAWQEDDSQSEDTLMKESTDGLESGKDMDTTSREDNSQSEDEPIDESEISDDVDTLPREDDPQPEDGFMEEPTDGLEISEDMDTFMWEDDSQPGDVFTEESADESETSEDTVLQEDILPQEDVLTLELMDESVTRDSTVPTPMEAYKAMIALKDQDMYKEGAIWTNDEPYSDSNGYRWKGGPLGGANIVARGCAAFAFTLSDAAFGSLPARMYASGNFKFEDIKVGDILRVENNAHTVIVLEVSDVGVIIAEGNFNGKVHWGRSMSKEDVLRDTSNYITRYPEGYISPDDSEANESIAHGTFGGGMTWNLTKAGTLTISGKGAMPNFSGTGDQPWNSKNSEIRKVVIENGITSIGSCAFWDCGVLSAEISDSVTTVGNSAFRGSKIVSVIIPSSVKTIGDSTFRECQNLRSVTISDGLETIDSNAFRGCTSLTSISLPASIGKVGDGVFMECTEMTSATFAFGTKQVMLGDNMFTRCYKLMNVPLPSKIDRIGEGMFQNCGKLVRVEIPQDAESIGGSAFASSGVSVVIIPDSVTTIGIAAFSACPLTDIYFTGTEAQWNNIQKIGDTASAVSKATIHYNHTPTTRPDPTPGDGDDNNNTPGNNPDNNPGDNNNNNPSDNPDNNPSDNPDNNPSDNNDNNPGDNNGNNSSDNPNNNHDGDKPGNTSNENNFGVNDPGENYSGINTVVETWKPTTPDEIERYACMGKEAIKYILPKDNGYQIDIENAMQGPMCFQAFELVLGDYTIGRTYNIYALSDTIYSTDEEIRITIEIPSAIYKKDREYKMICVTKGGQPFIYDDLDSNPETITIETNKFYAYALIYK